MAIRRILELGDPLLREVSREVTGSDEAAGVLDDLRDTLHEFQRGHGFGRGIAAVQIGQAVRVIYIELHGRRYELINPVMEWMSEEQFEMWDDCFSFPNLMVRLRRSRRVRLSYHDRAGEKQQIEAEDDFAELLQHEMDHLEGILSVDRAMCLRDSLMTRNEYLRTLVQKLS
jgi:peptide deformylase